MTTMTAPRIAIPRQRSMVRAVVVPPAVDAAIDLLPPAPPVKASEFLDTIAVELALRHGRHQIGRRLSVAEKVYALRVGRRMRMSDSLISERLGFSGTTLHRVQDLLARAVSDAVGA